MLSRVKLSVLYDQVCGVLCVNSSFFRAFLFSLGVAFWAVLVLIWAGHGEEMISQGLMNLAIFNFAGFPFFGFPIALLIFLLRDTYEVRIFYWGSLFIHLLPGLLMVAIVLVASLSGELRGHG